MNSRVKKILLKILEESKDSLLAFLANKLGCSQLAQDIFQETYIQIKEKPKLPKNISNPRAYVYTIAGNLAIDYLRRENLMARYLEKNKSEASLITDSLAALLEQNEKIEALRKAIDELPPKCKKVFLLNKFEGKTYLEISNELNISISMVEKHMMKALAHCRDKLQTAFPKNKR